MNQFKGAKIAYVVFALIIFGLVCNILYIGTTGMHFLSGNEIEVFAKSRGKKETVEYATRGEIYSSDGEAIATNVKKYRLIAIVSSNRPGYGDTAASVSDAVDTANQIAPLIGMDTAEMAAKLQSAIDNGSTYQVEFGSYGGNLNAGVKQEIETKNLPGLEFVEQTSRNYPLGNFASYIIGYAQSVEEKSIQHVVGKMGFELIYDEELSGTNGKKVYQVDATTGYALPNGVLQQEDAVNGNDIYSTINSDLQRNLDLQIAKTAQEVGAEIAAVGIMEAKTGKILAISNYPGFDPNTREINNYTDFFLNSAYECGSVFKPFVYANVINDGKYNGSETYVSGTYNVYYGSEFIAHIRDWNGGQGFGTITYDEGLAKSSNVGIANLIARYANKESLIEDYHKLGFFSASKIDGLDSASGVENYLNTTGSLEFMNTGFGQGSTVTALQLLRAYSAFANDGKTVEPYLVDRIVNPDTSEVVYTSKTHYSEQIYSSDTVTKINNLLYDNIYSDASAAKQYRVDGDSIQFSGKTGTGQISKGTSGYREDIYTKSFAGLAPYDDPEIVIYAVFQCPDEGTSGTIAEFVKTMVPIALAATNTYKTEDSLIDTDYQLDSYINQSTSYVKTKLESKALNIQVIGNGSVILEQFPKAQTSVSKNARIFLKTDSLEITIPNMVGWSRKDVLTFSSLSGITINVEGDTGLVIAQDVKEGTILHAGDTISVTLQQ